MSNKQINWNDVIKKLEKIDGEAKFLDQEVLGEDVKKWHEKMREPNCALTYTDPEEQAEREKQRLINRTKKYEKK